MRWNPMPSSVIRSFAYHPRAAALDVEFVSGRRYRYFGVPEGVATALGQAFSKGRFFNARIRDEFRCSELEAEAAEEPWALQDTAP